MPPIYKISLKGELNPYYIKSTEHIINADMSYIKLKVRSRKNSHNKLTFKKLILVTFFTL
jgi:hypothetical protein